MDFHGIKTRQIETSVSTPVVVGSGITFAVGTAPIHTTENPENKVNTVIVGDNYNQAITQLGYSDDWDKYSLGEVMYCHYKLYVVSPVIFVNVLNPAIHKKSVAEKTYNITNKKVLLPFEAISGTVSVKDYQVDVDYGLFYDNNNLVLEVLDTGNISAGVGQLAISFDEIDSSLVTKDDIIGGFDIVSNVNTGLELIDSVFPNHRIIPDLIICPGWSHIPEVAAVMGAKASAVNGLFEAKALCDVDTSTVKYYSDAALWKKDNNINTKFQALCFPMCKLGDRHFHLSTHMAALVAQVDFENGNCPARSPSNMPLQIDGAILKDGTELFLDINQANALNSNGIITALNFMSGFRLWGNYLACYPSNTDVKDFIFYVSRMFAWVASSVILSYWDKIDGNFDQRYIDSIVDSLNIWLNGLVASGRLLGARVEFRSDENNSAAIMSGKAVFRIFMTPPSPAQSLEFVLNYDVDYAKNLLGGA